MHIYLKYFVIKGHNGILWNANSHMIDNDNSSRFVDNYMGSI